MVGKELDFVKVKIVVKLKIDQRIHIVDDYVDYISGIYDIY